MPRSYIEMLFDLIGKIFFPRQQDWERRRNAKIMTATITFAVILSYILVWVIKHLNAKR